MRRRFLMSVCAVVSVMSPIVLPGLHASAPDIVLFASDAANMKGNWARAADSSAADGQALSAQTSVVTPKRRSPLPPILRVHLQRDRGHAVSRLVAAARGGEFEIQRFGLRAVLRRR